MGKKETLGWKPPETDMESSTDENDTFTPPASDIEEGTEKKNSQPASSNSNSQSASSTSDSSSDGFKQGKYDLPEGFQNFDIKAVTNQPEEVVKANQRKQMEERFRPESVKKADQKIKEVNSKIVDVSRQWNEIKKNQEQNIATLQNLKDQLEDPMVPDDQKAQLAGIYKQTYDSAVSTQESEKKVREAAIKLQQSKSTLNKVYDIQNKLDMDENDDIVKATGNFIAHVYNALPETVSGAGSLVESFGDVLKHPFDFGGPSTDYATAYEQFKEDQKDDKITDVIGKAIQNMGNDMKADTDAKYDDKHYISSTIGDIVGSIAVSAIPGSIAGKAGKAAQIMTGATTATMQMADGVHTKAKALGLSDEDAGLMTLSIAPISGLLEVWGASNIIDNISGKKIVNELITESTKKLAGQKVTKELVFSTVADTFKDVAKKYGLNAIKSAGEEGITEGAQQAVQDAAENIYDTTQDHDIYGTKFFSKETLLDIAQNAAIGAAAGSAFAVISGISSPKSIYDKAIELKNDPERLSQFRDMLETEVYAGHIDSEKADLIKNYINAMIVADDKVPPAITDPAKRFKAVELIKEKTALEEEIKGMDKAITTPQRDKIKDINSQLEAIATGKEPVKMHRRNMGQTEKPVNEKPVVVSNPLTEAEKVEYADLSRDQSLIGLEGDESARYNELKARNETIPEETRSSDENLAAATKSTIKESTENSVFPLIQKKAPQEKENLGESIVVQKTDAVKSKEKDAFVKEKIKELKKDQGADFDAALLPVYKQPFAAKYDLLTEHKLFEDETENEGAIDQFPNTDTPEYEPSIKAIEEKELPTSVEGIDEQIAEIDKVLKPVHKLKGKLPVIFERALKHEASNATHIVMQHFIRGGKINKIAMQEMFGGGKNGAKNVASENKLREGFIDNSTKAGVSSSYSAIEDLAEQLHDQQDHPTIPVEDFRDAIESVLLEHNSRKSMANSLNEAFVGKSAKAEQEANERAKYEKNNPNPTTEEETATTTPNTENVLGDNDDVKAPVSDYEGDIPIQKVMESNKFTKSQKRVAKSINNVVKALGEIAPGLKVTLHETADSFEKAAYEANKKLGATEEKARKNVSGNAFYLGKDNVIHINLPNVKSNTLFHEGTHPILNMVEEMRPGTIDAMFDQLPAIEKAIGMDGHYTEDFVAPYGEASKKMEAVTEFIADVADGRVKIDDSNFTKIKRFFGKLLQAMGIKIKSLTEDTIVSLAKKIQKGFEKGELIDIATNRELREIVAGKYDQKTLAAVELEKQMAKAEDEMKAAKNAFDKKRKELDTTIVADQEDLFGERKSTAAGGGGGMFDERVDVTQRDKVMEPFKVRLEKAADNVSSLRKKLADEEGKQDLLLFQSPGAGNQDISESDIKWALKTFQKLGNDFEKFRTKLNSTVAGRELLSKNLFAAMLEYNSEHPMASVSDRLKAVSDHLQKADFVPEELKDKLEENGLRGEVFSHEEARTIADAAIKLLGVDGAVDLAERRLKGSVRAFIYGAAVDYYAKRVSESTNTFERDQLAQKGADISEQFQKDAEDYGRFISAIGDYYKNSPLIIGKTVINQLRTQAKQALAKMKGSVNKVKAVKRGFSNVINKKVGTPKVGTPRTSATISNTASRAVKRTELLDRWNTLKNQAPGPQKQVDEFSQEQTDVLVEMGVIHVADGAWTFPSWYKKMKADFGISEKAARQVWEKEKMPAELDAGERTISAMLKEDFGDTDEYKRQQKALLNKYFPKKKLKTEQAHKDETDKIIEKYNAGVFDGGKNSEGEEFQKLFFDKLGIVNPDAPEIQARIGELAERIGAAPENSIMQREAKEDMLNYLANIAYESRMKATANRLSSIWYANILSSPATHLRNIQYNVISTAISQPFMLMEKAIIAKDYGAIPAMIKNMVEGFKKGFTESKRVMKTGRSSRFDKPGAMSDLERGSKYTKPFVIPGRALKASDILFTDAAYSTKLSELSRQLIRKEHAEYTSAQIDIASNELLGNTAERKAAAVTQAEQEMEKFYGKDWRSMKGADNISKIRQFEIMDSSIPVELRESAEKYSKKALLTSRPTGVLGVLADAINGLNQRLYFTKFVMPFVNVPFNLVNAMVERSPIGLIKAFRRAEGFGSFKEELSDDEVKELYLKVVNYTVAMVALSLMNGDKDDDKFVITGAQTGDFMDNKGVVRSGGLEPYSVYIGGKKVMSYKTSPWAAALMVPGYIRDAKLYAEQKSATDIAAYSAFNWLLFINDQSAMQGVQGLVSTVAEAKKTSSETVTTTLAKYAQNMVLPFSGALKFFNNTTKALMGENDLRPIDPWEYITRDVPFLDQLARTRKDHFGQDVKETFDIPMLPVGQRGVFEAMSDTSKYYKLCVDKGFFPKFSTTRRFPVGGHEVNITKKELDDINTDRGQLVKQALDSKNVFVPKSDDDSAEEGGETEESEMTTMEYLKGLDNEDFKKKMTKLFEEATKLARIRKYGSMVGVTSQALDKAKQKADELDSSGDDVITPEEDKNKRLLEEYNDSGRIRIEVEDY